MMNVKTLLRRSNEKSFGGIIRGSSPLIFRCTQLPTSQLIGLSSDTFLSTTEKYRFHAKQQTMASRQRLVYVI